MMITEIKRLKRGHYQLLGDGQSLTVTESMLFDYQLYRGQQLDAAKIEELNRQYSQRCCYQKALSLVARRDHFVAELRQKLERRDYDVLAIDHALNRLKQLGYLNEAKHAALLVASYRHSESLLGIRQRLQRKGCPALIIERELSRIQLDEQANATALLLKKTAFMRRRAIVQQRQKLLRYLIGRGFNYGIAQRSYQEVVELSK